MEFIGRQREMDMLVRAYQSGQSSLIPIYGRRRIGKSELVRQFLRDRPGIYLMGKQAPESHQIQEFLHLSATVLHEPLLSRLAVTGWKEALEIVLEKWTSEVPLVIALDEFQWLVESSPELPSVLQELWDVQWQHSNRVMLLLCGSHIGFMERNVLGRKSPLFGRRTAQILLRPFGHVEAARFQRGYSLTDRARTWFICGGVALYHRYFSSDRSVEMNIRTCLLEEFAPLFREADFLLREELREVENYHAVLMALARGSATGPDIATTSGIPSSSLPYYLNQLTELGYVARRYPLTTKPPAARHVRFAIADPLLRFWFRFVFPNISFVLHMGDERAFTRRVAPQLDAFYGEGFERLCRQALPALYRREGVAAAFEVGEFWSPAVQIDVVGVRDDGWTDLGECRFGKVRSTRAIADELVDKVQKYPNPHNATIGKRIFTRDAIPEARRAPGFRYHSLADLYDDNET